MSASTQTGWQIAGESSQKARFPFSDASVAGGAKDETVPTRKKGHFRGFIWRFGLGDVACRGHACCSSESAMTQCFKR